MRALTVALLAFAVPRIARADDPPPPAPAPPPPGPTPQELADQIEDLKQAQQELETKIAHVGQQTSRQEPIIQRLDRFITVFVDVGAFAVGGNGSGIRSDIAHVYYPQYAGSVPGQWVVMGDPLSTAINSLGEPADLSDSREVTGDNLKSGGHPSILVNSLGLAIHKDVGHDIAVWGLAELLPRPSGDRLDVELAYIEYRPIVGLVDDLELVLQAGQVDSVLGVEYRSQDAPRRLTVTPSLIGRYTSGRTPGIEARLEYKRLSASAALANGDFFDKRFEPAQALHANALPTAAGHLQWRFPVGQELQLGVSGAIGPQTNQSDLGVMQWHYGLDAQLVDLDGFDVKAEYVQGREEGKTTGPVRCDAAPCLRYKGAYLLLDRRLNPWFIPYVRLDYRDAVHESGAQFVYESHVARATFGAHFEVTSRILWKIEYTLNHELDNIPQFPDDIVTTSVVVQTD